MLSLACLRRQPASQPFSAPLITSALVDRFVAPPTKVCLDANELSLSLLLGGWMSYDDRVVVQSSLMMLNELHARVDDDDAHDAYEQRNNRVSLFPFIVSHPKFHNAPSRRLCARVPARSFCARKIITIVAGRLVHSKLASFQFCSLIELVASNCDSIDLGYRGTGRNNYLEVHTSVLLTWLRPSSARRRRAKPEGAEVDRCAATFLSQYTT